MNNTEYINRRNQFRNAIQILDLEQKLDELGIKIQSDEYGAWWDLNGDSFTFTPDIDTPLLRQDHQPDFDRSTERDVDLDFEWVKSLEDWTKS